MKKFYEEPELELVTFHAEDTVVTSAGQCAGNPSDEGDTCEGFDNE